MSIQGQELHMCCSEIAGNEGIPLCHLVPLWLLMCLLVGMQLSSPAGCCIMCWQRSALVMSSLLWALLLQGCSSSPSASNQCSVCGESFVNTAVATPWSMTLGREESSSRPLKCVDLQLISNSLDFSCQALLSVIEAMAVFIREWSFRMGCTAFEMGLKCKPVALISICMI